MADIPLTGKRNASRTSRPRFVTIRKVTWAPKSVYRRRCTTSSRTSIRRRPPTWTAACTAACVRTPVTIMCVRTIRAIRRSGRSSCSSRRTNAKSALLPSSIVCSASRRKSRSSSSKNGSTCCTTAALSADAVHWSARWASTLPAWSRWRDTACSKQVWSRTNCMKQRNVRLRPAVRWG